MEPDIVAKQLFDKASELSLLPNVTFVVGTKNVRNYKSKELVDFIRCPSFARFFRSESIDVNLKKKNTEIHLPKIEPNQFIYLLKYVYEDKIYKRDFEISETCLLANKFNLFELSNKLIQFCDLDLKIINSIMIYDQFLKLGDLVNEYMAKLVEMVNLHADLVFKTMHFRRISKETLIKLLESDDLFIKEKDVYYACIDWINAELNRQNLKINQANQLKLFNEIKKLIRFTLMTKDQFNCGPAKSGLFLDEELKEFEKYFETNDTKVLSTNYNFKERNALAIYKLKFNKTDEEFNQENRFFNDPLNNYESEIEESSFKMDFNERNDLLKKNFGKNYFNDKIRKKRVSPKKESTEGKQIEYIHLFKFRVLVNKKEWNDDLDLELYSNGKKLNLKFLKYVKSGHFYFSLDKPVPVSNDKEYRLCFRTLSNICYFNRFQIKNVVQINEEESKIDVKFEIQDDDCLSADKIEIFFTYKENYVPSIEETMTEDESSVTPKRKRKPKKVKKEIGSESEEEDILMDESSNIGSSVEKSKEKKGKKFFSKNDKDSEIEDLVLDESSEKSKVNQTNKPAAKKTTKKVKKDNDLEIEDFNENLTEKPKGKGRKKAKDVELLKSKNENLNEKPKRASKEKTTKKANFKFEELDDSFEKIKVTKKPASKKSTKRVKSEESENDENIDLNDESSDFLDDKKGRKKLTAARKKKKIQISDDDGDEDLMIVD